MVIHGFLLLVVVAVSAIATNAMTGDPYLAIGYTLLIIISYSFLQLLSEIRSLRNIGVDNASKNAQEHRPSGASEEYTNPNG